MSIDKFEGVRKMNKNKGILSLVLTVAIIALLGYLNLQNLEKIIIG